MKTAVVTPVEVIGDDVFSSFPYGIDNELKEQLGDNFIAIEKPQGLSEEYAFTLEDIAVDRRINITISGLTNALIDCSQIHRIYGNNYNYGLPIVLSPSPTLMPELGEEEVTYDESSLPTMILTDNVTSIQLTNTVDATSNEKSVVITLDLIKTYAYLLEEDDHYFYIALVKPQDVYDTIIVLDAGHGGLDSGTYSKGYDYLEKDMNLDMLLRLQEYLQQHENIKIYTTRTTDRRLTLNQRVNLANDVEADLFLSIHCNANLSKNIKGTEVLYNDKQNDWAIFNSKQFATICQEDLIACIGLKDRGIVPRSHNVYIVGEAHMPVALVEVAFMSNLSDLNFLKQEHNRQKVSEGIYHGIMRSLEMKDKTN
jgi:N-acetylmuramoyl-L-alanine amidase